MDVAHSLSLALSVGQWGKRWLDINHIFEAHGGMHVRYYVTEIVDVQLKRTQRSERLCTTDNKTFTGTVGDAVFGAKHTMDGNEVSHRRACVQKGSKYDLVVGDKVYILDINDQSSPDTLDKLAGQQVKVKGEASGDTIEVQSVAAKE